MIIKSIEKQNRERQKIIMLSHDWQLKCPIYQERLRMLMLQHPMPRRQIKEWMVNFFRDNPDILYMMEAPHIDTFMSDESGKIMENFLRGMYSKNPALMRWADALMKELHPELVLFAQEHEEQFLLPDDESITFH